jgi:hypothetical protein
MTKAELVNLAISLGALVIALHGVRVAKRTANAAIEHDKATRQKERDAAAAKRFVSIYTLPDRVTGHNEARRLAGELFAELGGDKPGRYAATVAYMSFCGGGQGSQPEQTRKECDRIAGCLRKGEPWEGAFKLAYDFANTVRHNEGVAGRKAFEWLIAPHDGPVSGPVSMGHVDTVEASPELAKKVLASLAKHKV